MFLKNNRDLPVKNGSLGTVTELASGAIAVRLDGQGRARSRVSTRRLFRARLRLRGDDSQGTGSDTGTNLRAGDTRNGSASRLRRDDPSSGAGGNLCKQGGLPELQGSQRACIARTNEGHDARLHGAPRSRT